MRGDPLLAGNHRVEFSEVTISPHYREKSQVVSVRRFWREFVTLLGALRKVPRSEYCLLVFLSATSTAILAASLLAMTGWRRIGVEVCLHGNLVNLTGWRSRNPVIRRLDLQAMLARRRARPVRFLVHEESIKQELGQLVPRALAVTDVLPLPANPAEIASCGAMSLRYPVRIGLVGQATEARESHHSWRRPGCSSRSMASKSSSAWSGGSSRATIFHASPAWMSRCPRQIARDDFRKLLGRLHFVFLPLQPEYYRLAASGALLDAITWLKPVIATSVPIMADIFAQYGDIGYLCGSAEDMQRALHVVLTEMDSVVTRVRSKPCDEPAKPGCQSLWRGTFGACCRPIFVSCYRWLPVLTDNSEFVQQVFRRPAARLGCACSQGVWHA